MKLEGKNVLVTGGTRRIGREIANAFARRGANVLIHSHSSPSSGTLKADLLKVSEIDKMVKRILKESGGVDVLVNNASLFYRTPFEKVREKDWDDFLAIHLKAPFFLAQALAPTMKKRGGGRIINIADWSGLRPYRDYLPYCVSKGAMITMTEALAKTLAPEVLVTAVCPGPILPPESLSKKERDDVARKTLVRRWGRPEDVARLVVFLAESDFITGSYHLVDGGESLRG